MTLTEAATDDLSLPSAAPYPYTFRPSRTALILIDIQRDFVDPAGFGSVQCGSPAVFSRVRSVVPRIETALAAARRLGLHVVHTREGHEPDLADLTPAKRYRQVNAPGGHHEIGIGDQGPMGRLLVRGEYGHDIVDELKPVEGEVVVDKPGKGSFWATGLHRALMARGVTHLIFCGVTTECCVTTTAREANDRGFECCILRDCTGGFDENFVTTSLNMICSFDGLFGYTAPSSDFLALTDSKTALTTPPKTPPISKERSMDLKTLSEQYRSGQLDPTDLVQGVFDRIEEYESVNPHVWIHLRSRQELLEEAKALSAKWKGKTLPLLYGIPFAVKDNFDVAGIPTTAACPEYMYHPKETAPVVAALISAGALLIGKTNMDQLATGLSGCRSPYGKLCSVYGERKYISGGSSSGSGVAVAAGVVTFALGTDTAGSGRVPAAFNGIVGYKPTKGTLSGRGVVPACKSLDTTSIFATSVLDARKVWYVVDFYDQEDAYAKLPDTLPLAPVDYRGPEKGGFSFFYPPPSALDVCVPEYKTLFSNAIETIQKLGGHPTALSDEDWEPFQKASNLLYAGSLVNERISSIGATFITSKLDTLHSTTRALFQAVLERPTKPWEIFSDQATQTECIRQAQRLFAKTDILVLPTVPFHPTIEAMEVDPIGLNAKIGEYTHFANVLDLCAVSINAGYSDGPHGRMPFGLSLVGASGLDGRMFDIAELLERGMSKVG